MDGDADRRSKDAGDWEGRLVKDRKRREIRIGWTESLLLHYSVETARVSGRHGEEVATERENGKGLESSGPESRLTSESGVRRTAGAWAMITGDGLEQDQRQGAMRMGRLTEGLVSPAHWWAKMMRGRRAKARVR